MHLSRRSFVAGTGFAVASMVFGCAGHKNKGASKKQSNFTIERNPTDPRLLRVKSGSNLITYIGTRTATGTAMTLTGVLVANAQSTTFFAVDSGSRPLHILAPNGTTMDLIWTSATAAVIVATTPDGSQQINTNIDFANASKGLSSGTAMPALKPEVAPRRSGQVRGSHRSIVPRNSQSYGVGKVNGVGQVKPFDTTTGSGLCSVAITRCGQPDTGYDDVYIHVSEVDGNALGSFHAYKVSDGVYESQIPTNLNPSVNVHDLVESVVGVLDASAEVLESLGGPKAIAALIGASLAAAGATAGLSAVVEALIIPPLVAALLLLELWGNTIGKSPAEGAPSLAEELADAIPESLVIPGKVLLNASVYALPDDFLGPSVSAPGEGPFPALSLEIGGTPVLRSLTLDPSAPPAGEDYTSTLDAYCLPVGTQVLLSISGTDGYTGSATYTVDGSDQTGTFVLDVPGAVSGIVDTDTAMVTLPDGTVLTRTASLVFS